jgi:hypothetical protein
MFFANFRKRKNFRSRAVSNSTLPKAIICDIDGTIAKMHDRGPYDVTLYHTDVLNEPVADLVDRYVDDGFYILFVTGRKEDHRLETSAWLQSFQYLDGDEKQHLFMRKHRDLRNDSVVKRELFDEHIRGKFDVRFVLDDRNRVVNMWRNLGLTVFQVEKGNF